MANQKKTITEPRREIPVRAEVDVLVVRGAPPANTVPASSM